MDQSLRQLLAAGKSGAGWISTAVGSGLMNTMRSNVQHPFDRMFFRNTANLAGQTVNFFQVPIGGNYNVLNGGGSQITKTQADTNWDMANQAQYDYLLTGMYLKVQNLTQQPYQAAPNDLTSWPEYLKTLLEDSFVQITVEDNVLTRQKAIHFPEGNAVTGALASASGTVASTLGQNIASSGHPAQSNIFGFGMNALWIPKGTRLNVGLTFGASQLTADAVYKPAANVIFAEVRFQGVKFQATV